MSSLGEADVVSDCSHKHHPELTDENLLATILSKHYQGDSTDSCSITVLDICGNKAGTASALRYGRLNG